MEQSPSWVANRFLASKEIPRILWNPEVLHRVYRSPPPLPILSQINLVQATPPPHSTSWSSILISSHIRLGLPSGLFPSGFPHKTPVFTSPIAHTCYVPRPSHSSRFEHLTSIWWGDTTVSLNNVFICSLMIFCPGCLVTEWGDRAATSTCDCILLGKPKNLFLIKAAG